MATQVIPNFEQMGTPAVARVFHRPEISRRPAALSARTAARQSQERQRLLVEMLPLVKRMAFKIRQHLPAHVEVDDLIANGVLGLVDAVSKFDTTKRVKLESYARHRVRGAILDGLRSADPASRDLRRNNKKIQKLYRELEGKLGGPVEDEVMATAMGLDLAEWHRTISEIQSIGVDFGPRILSAGPTTKRASADLGLLPSYELDPFDRCYRQEQRDILGRALSHLRERERQIISLYYQRELTMKQIAESLNIDESRVSQLHSAALTRLKGSVNSILHPSPARHATSAPASVARSAT